MKFRLIIISLLFSSCQGVVYDVPLDVDLHIKTFESEAKLRGFDYEIDNIRVFFVLDDNMMCAMADIKASKNGRISLRLNKRYWNAYKDYPLRREALIMHELGHYPLMRSHNGKIESLMSGNTWSIINYEKHRDEMLDELFK